MHNVNRIRIKSAVNEVGSILTHTKHKKAIGMDKTVDNKLRILNGKLIVVGLKQRYSSHKVSLDSLTFI